MRPALVLLAGATALVAPAAALGQLGPAAAPQAPSEIRSASLDAAAGWRDSLSAFRAPLMPTPGDLESVVLLLSEPPVSAAAPTQRRAAARRLAAQQEALETTLGSLGATVTFRYRMLINGLAVQLPAGRLEAIAALPQIAAVVPVSFLAPAQAGSPVAAGRKAAGAAPAVAPGARPLHIALIDAGVDVAHPWLGGGIGPTFPIIGGADLVDGDADPRPGAGDPATEAHGTQMASLVLRSAALEGLAPADVPRLLAYRVVAPEPVGGRMRALARSDRVLAALERAVDPDGNGDASDSAEVILLGLAESMAGGGIDPVAQALAAADRLGASVIAPAGNDGPTFARPGSVGGPAAEPTVIAVGGLSAPVAPRSAYLDVRLGPAAARLGPLPLMGPAPSPAALPVVVLRDDAGISTGAAPEAFVDAAGATRVAGALVVVARGGGPLAETVARAAAAGAAALAVWDEDGLATFPAIPGSAGLAAPIVGLGAQQGAALMGLAADDPSLTATLAPQPTAPTGPAVASFSSWGPTLEGRQKPDLVAPAVDLDAAWPGSAGDGAALSAPLTGTSAAAAQVAALAVRLRVDHPDLGPRSVHALLTQAARPLRGVAVERQGAGVASAPHAGAVRLRPAIVVSERARGVRRARIVLTSPGRLAGPVSVRFANGRRERILAGRVILAPGRPRSLTLLMPSRASGRLVVRAQDGEALVSAPVVPLRPARTPGAALGRPEVRADGRLAEVRVRLGFLRREGGRVLGVRVHGVRLSLVPVRGGDVLPVSGRKQRAAWPAGTYRFLLARRLASGLAVAPGRYRVRVSAVGPDGTPLRSESRAFRLG